MTIKPIHYTPNIVESIRIEIGKLLIGHEIFKLIPNADYEKIKEQINCKWNKLDDTVKVRDFWNLADSLMMGYKLKDIIRLITSLQIDWSLTKPKIDDLRFSSEIIKIQGFEIRTKTVKEVSSYLLVHDAELQNVKLNTQKEFSIANPRSKDPIIVEKYSDGALHVHDGNGRLLQSIIEKRDTIDAYIGTHNSLPKSNHWISTSYIQRLSDEKQKELLVKVLQESENAVFEFKDRVNTENEFKGKVLECVIKAVR